MQKSLDWQRMNNKGTMEQKNKIVPERRFPEFVNDGVWKEKIVGDILQSESSTMALNKLELKQSGYKVYGADSVVGYINFYQQEEKYISIVKDGSGVGRLNLCEGKTSILGTLSCLKSKNKEKYNLVWSYYLLNTIDFSSYVKGAGIPHIYYSDYKNEKVSVPKPKEQQKIADCLSSLDELITAHNDKLETLKNHKKGLLQNLFPQEGQTVPNYRFPEFMNDGDWEIKTVSEVAYYENGKAHEQHIIINGKYKVVNSKFISTDGEVVKYTNEALCLANINDTLMVLSDVPNGRAIAKCFYVDKNNTYTVNQRICKLKPLDINGKILYYLLNRNPYFLAFDDGVKQTNLKNDDVLNCEIVLPKKTKIQKEQQKIADCLLAVDNLITAQTEKIEQLKAHKKGLMQELFPKIEE